MTTFPNVPTADLARIADAAATSIIDRSDRCSAGPQAAPIAVAQLELSHSLSPGGSNTSRMLCAFSISPIGVGESVSAEVAEVVRLVRESGLPNETNAMFTNVPPRGCR
jgi:hypothetical protein